MDEGPLFQFDDMMRWASGELPPEWFHTQARIAIHRAKKQYEEWVELLRWAKVNDPDLHARLTTMTF